MTRCSLIPILALTLLLLCPLSGQAQPESTVPPGAGLHLLHSDANGVVLELTTPAYDLTAETLPAVRPAHHDAGPFQRLTIPGYDVTQEAGRPQVPVMNTLLGVPPDARIELRILADDAAPLAGRFRLRPAPHPAPLAEDLQPGELIFEPDQIAYTTDALYPASPARLAGDAGLRDQRIVRVELYPFQYNPAKGTLLWRRRLRVEVRFTGPGREKGEKGKRERGDVQDSPFEFVLRGMLLNYEEAGVWRRRLPQHAPRTTQDVRRETQDAMPNTQYPIPDTQSSTTPRYKITIDHDALHRLTYADLEAAGMDLDSVDPRTFHLTSQGKDVAIYVVGEDDGRFDPGDTITFYGQKFRGDVLAERYADEMADWLTLCPKCELAGMFEKYTDENVYWLTTGGEPGPRMATIDGTPTDTAPAPSFYRATVHAEQSHKWYTHHFTSEDTWFWDRVQPGPADATRTYTTTLTAVATGSYTATVRASIASRSSNAGHHTRFYLNGGAEPLDDATWDGKSRYAFEAQVPQSRLLRSANPLFLPLVRVDKQSTTSLDSGRPGINRKTRDAIERDRSQSHLFKRVVQLEFAILFNGAFEDMYFDWFEIEYARQFQAEDDQLLFSEEEAGLRQYEIGNLLSDVVEAYDVTDPFSPRRVLNPRVIAARGAYSVAFEASQKAGAQYFVVGASAVQTPKRVSRYVPSDFASTAGADYVFITHRDFITATQALANYRANQGLSTMVVDVADLYNEFNYGIYHPIAIRNFLAYAFANWETRPTYVLLVGDGHWNLKGYSGYDASPIYIPPNLAWVDPWQGEVDSTNLLAAVVGDDILPDLAIGRLPVNNVEELNAAIDKIIAYEQAEPGEWQRRALFVADNVPDAAGDFVSLADDVIANHLPAGVEADRIYLNDYCGSPTSPPTPCPEVNAAIVDDLNGPGALLVNYIGHASVDRWAHEQIFVNGDIPSLSNGGRLPVVLSMTCLDGYFYYPGRPSLAEELVRADGYGAVSTFSPTGLGVATGHHVMQRRFYDAVYRDGVRELGPATLAAKAALYATGWNYDLIHTFTIFGDPALRLQAPASEVHRPLLAR